MGRCSDIRDGGGGGVLCDICGAETRIDKRMMEEARKEWAEDRMELPERRVSPFFEPSTTVGMDEAAVGSQLEVALVEASTDKGERVEASSLTGLKEDVVMQDVEVVVVGQEEGGRVDDMEVDTAHE